MSTRSTSYLKTRIRGSRLLNVACLLLLAELTQRLHQAYAQAYDKQAADQLLPQNPPVIFLTAQLLSNDKDPRVLCESKFEPTGFGTDTAALNVETDSGPAALSGDTFTVRANFLLPKYTKLFARSTGDSGSRVILGKDNRYRFPTEKEAPLGSSYAFFDDGDRRGHVDITLKLRDIEATKNSIFVTVAGVYESGELFSGQASLKIIGNNERPKTPCRPR